MNASEEPPPEGSGQGARARWAGAPLNRRRLLGIDRSGGPPPETLRGQPWRPWTVPNFISYIRLGLLPVFIAVALSADDQRSATAAVIYFAIAWGDQLDGFAARLTGQYSRLGALLDPLTDRALVLSGVYVCFYFELLPRWALITLAARELFMLGLTRLGLRKGMELSINQVGRWAVWPVMFAIFLTLIVDTPVATGSLMLGLAMTLLATALYVREGMRFLAAERRASPSSST